MPCRSAKSFHKGVFKALRIFSSVLGDLRSSSALFGQIVPSPKNVPLSGRTTGSKMARGVFGGLLHYAIV
jgi:hypothetical protein